MIITRILLLIILLTSCTPEINKNNLQKERSLFLKKSQNDQIFWQTWNPLVFEKAKKENKLIYLTIGYGTCFACDKMQAESYAKENVAKILNKNFISIKVDREENPDIDIHFLNLQTAIMKFGAWPINFILTSDLKPIFATTYMEPTQFINLLKQIDTAWKKEPETIITQVDQFLLQLIPDEGKILDYNVDESLISDYYARYTHQFDSVYGGIGVGANFEPKFPVNDDMRLLLRHFFRKKEQQALQMVKKTILTIAQSALLDPIEGGIHRYSTSRDWNTPNFEKVLMDQASFINILTELNHISPNPFLEQTIDKMINFLMNNFLNPRGGFYSSQSSSLNGQDGLYYTWQEHEVQSTLSKENFSIFNKVFSLNQPLVQFQQRRTLSLRNPSYSEEQNLVTSELLKSKYKKNKPEIDKKIMTAQSAFTISALSKLAKTLPSSDFTLIIKKSLDFILTQHTNVNGTFYRQSTNGETKDSAILDDYAYLIDALIEFYQLSFDESYLLKAMKLQKKQDDLFFDKKKNLYLFNPHSQKLFGPQFLMKDLPYPSGQSMSYFNLVRLALYYPNHDFKQKYQSILRSYPDQLKLEPQSYTHLLLAVDFEISSPQNLIISGNLIECQNQSKKVYAKYFPYLLVSCASGDSDLPIHSGKIKKELKFFVCNQNSCLPEFDSIENALKGIYTLEL